MRKVLIKMIMDEFDDETTDKDNKVTERGLKLLIRTIPTESDEE